jgi:hypothetical protein
MNKMKTFAKIGFSKNKRELKKSLFPQEKIILFYRPYFVDLLGNQVEVVTEFKLL